MVFVQIEGTLDELRGVAKLAGLQLSRGAHDLGGGRWRAAGVVESKAVLDELAARGLKVTITLDENAVDRRLKNEPEGEPDKK